MEGDTDPIVICGYVIGCHHASLHDLKNYDAFSWMERNFKNSYIRKNFMEAAVK